MKRFAIILLLFTFLSSNAVFGELFKLPALIHHYLDHRQLENSVSFLDFIKEHYINVAKHGDYTHHHHENLPFKSLDSHPNPVFTIVYTYPFVIDKIVITKDDVAVCIYQDDNYSDNYLDKIWQPPRLC